MYNRTAAAAVSVSAILMSSLTACGGDQESSGEKITVSMSAGSVSTNTSAGHESCKLYSGGTVSTGDRIKLSDNEGTPIGFSELEASEVFLDEIKNSNGSDPRFCGFTAVFDDVPSDEISYTVSIPNVKDLEVAQEDIKDGIDLERDDGLGNIEGKVISISLGAINSQEIEVSRS